jgi:hypothetical protein
MREVPVPTAIAAHPLRRPLMLIAAWLVALQAFLAGVATAQAGSMSVADPFGVICHGADAGNPAQAPASDAGKVWHLCCTFCLSSVPALAAPDAPPIVSASGLVAPPPILSRFGLVLAHGVIRAGPSQAPPASA